MSTAHDPWHAFAAARPRYLDELEAVIRAAVPRRDTAWPAFHGCYDWHSAVHGVYALHAIHRLTGAPLCLEVADSVLTASAIREEQTLLEAGGVPGELPYGYAWLLALARERELATGRADLAPLATAAAKRLAAWMRALSSTAFSTAVHADDYRNLSWALLNLGEWSAHTGHQAHVALAEGLARQLMGLDASLPLGRDLDAPRNFFPPALHRVLAVLTLLPEEETADWISDLLPERFDLRPVETPQTAHLAGLNFSRAWGLWRLWQVTGEARWRTLYVDHLQTHLSRPEYWAVNYDAHSHWVPQFGVYALALSMGDESELHA
ncbi:MAG: DUF2891 domain-containing protein [Myxococcales bacterium]|nr:DUF2891 domain-containing protein [Myxococcales bacterium]